MNVHLQGGCNCLVEAATHAVLVSCAEIFSPLLQRCEMTTGKCALEIKTPHWPHTSDSIFAPFNACCRSNKCRSHIGSVVMMMVGSVSHLSIVFCGLELVEVKRQRSRERGRASEGCRHNQTALWYIVGCCSEAAASDLAL